MSFVYLPTAAFTNACSPVSKAPCYFCETPPSIPTSAAAPPSKVKRCCATCINPQAEAYAQCNREAYSNFSYCQQHHNAYVQSYNSYKSISNDVLSYDITKIGHKLSIPEIKTREYYNSTLKLLVPKIDEMLDKREQHTFLFFNYCQEEKDTETHNKINKRLETLLKIIKPYYDKWHQEDEINKISTPIVKPITQQPQEEFPYLIPTAEEIRKMKQEASLRAVEVEQKRLQVERDRLLTLQQKEKDLKAQEKTNKANETKLIAELPVERITLKPIKRNIIADPLVFGQCNYRDERGLKSLTVSAEIGTAYYNVVDKFNQHIFPQIPKSQTPLVILTRMIVEALDTVSLQLLGVVLVKEYSDRLSSFNKPFVSYIIKESDVKRVIKDVTPSILTLYQLLLKEYDNKQTDVYYIIAQSLLPAIITSPFFIIPTIETIDDVGSVFGHWVDYPPVNQKLIDHFTKIKKKFDKLGGVTDIIEITMGPLGKNAGKMIKSSMSDPPPPRDPSSSINNLVIKIKLLNGDIYWYITPNEYDESILYLSQKLLRIKNVIISNEDHEVFREALEYQIFEQYSEDIFNPKMSTRKDIYQVYRVWLMFAGGLYAIFDLPFSVNYCYTIGFNVLTLLSDVIKREFKDG